MSNTTTELDKTLDEAIRLGFQMGLNWTEFAIKYGDDPVELLKRKLAEWDEEHGVSHE